MISVEAIDHVGIRVVDEQRALEFYAKLGFVPIFRGGPEPVVVLRNAAGIELNLILNAVPHASFKNVLYDAPAKWAGYTHMALRVPSIDETARELSALGITVTEGPVRLGDGVALFVRDPDGNVIELRQPLEEAP